MTTTTEAETYTTVNLCRLTGVTYREIDWWVRLKLITPAVPARGSGSRREFTADQLALIHYVVGLRAAGFGLEPAFAVAAALVRDGYYATFHSVTAGGDRHQLTIAAAVTVTAEET